MTRESHTAYVATLLVPSMAEQLKRLAEASDRSVAAEVRAAIRDHLAREGRPR